CFTCNERHCFTWNCNEPLGDSPTPARGLQDQVVKIARRNTRNARGLRQRAWSNALELLARLCREGSKLQVGQVRRKNERRQLGESRSCLAFARQIAVVLDLDLRRHDGLGRRLRADICAAEQRLE